MDFEKEIAAAQLASLVDTDGCISFWRRTHPYGVYIGPRVTFVNTDRRLVEHFAKLCDRLGVKHSPVLYKAPKNPERHKPKLVLNVSKRRELKIFFGFVLRYLVGKRKQGAFLSAICTAKCHNKRGQPPWVAVYADRINALNRRGPKTLPIASTSGGTTCVQTVRRGSRLQARSRDSRTA
jgi:hypothetical protein